jgi:Fe-S-cluster containining protein
MNCDACRGACCETLHVLGDAIARQSPTSSEFIRVFAGAEDGHGDIELKVRCSKLTSEGLCSIYERRPLICRLFKPGSPDCIAAVKARRSPAQRASIREAGDPSL